MNKHFEKQVAVITGGTSGIGAAVAKRLQEEGAVIAILDMKAAPLNDGGHFFQTDVSDEASVQRSIASVIDELGTVDILVNCAGITGVTNVKSHDTSTQNVKNVFDVNFFGSYYTSKHVLPVMLQKNYGRILHIASVAGKEGNAGMLAYSASKAAVIGMTKVQGKEYAETGVTINALAPAVIRTALVDNMPDEQVKYMTDKIPMKRCGTLAEVADMAAFIVSPQNSFVTGFTFDLTGGRATY
ncbi:MAG TPA: SDR family NAD(P)-dependent oxidoreductase [Panacibacter sp.]|nr:SDR family NAD(P)-dependent oxidoreductase [Panacibacter sp.]HNP45273.1 SDR family NAD(P)-dependent oxidoreductase [Panacibacter sp.]